MFFGRLHRRVFYRLNDLLFVKHASAVLENATNHLFGLLSIEIIVNFDVFGRFFTLFIIIFSVLLTDHLRLMLALGGHRGILIVVLLRVRHDARQILQLLLFILRRFRDSVEFLN